MHQQDQPSSSTQIHVELEGEYCTIQHDYVSKATQVQRKPDTLKKTPAIPSSKSYKPQNSSPKTSPKRKVFRSRSSPEHVTSHSQVNSLEKDKQASMTNAHQWDNRKPNFVVSCGRGSAGHDVKVGGRRSTGSLTGWEPFPPPLRYFAYLGRLAPSTKASQIPRSTRLLSAHDMLADRPVLLTSTSVVSPFATNVIRQEIEEIECQERQANYHDLLDCCTCMCCVKGLFYHCTDASVDEDTLYRHPCSCKGPVRECAGRWGIMGLVSIFLPCLLCYLPFELCFRCHDCVTRETNTKDMNTSPASKSNCPTVVTQEPTSSVTDSRSDTGV